MEKLDEALDYFIAGANLIYEQCYLNHGSGQERPQAVNYLCQDVGAGNNIQDTLRIPICAECAEALYDEVWLLFYCLTCNSSQWLLKSKAKKYYPKWESIRFLSQCPICVNKGKKEELNKI